MTVIGWARWFWIGCKRQVASSKRQGGKVALFFGYCCSTDTKSEIRNPKSEIGLEALARALGARAVCNEPLSRHTTARIGGPADLYVEALTVEDLHNFVLQARQCGVPYLVLGSGSNVLMGETGVRGLVIANKAKNFKFGIQKPQTDVLNLEPVLRRPPSETLASLQAGGSVEPSRSVAEGSEIFVWAESGVVLPTLARKCIERGYANLEWAVGVPGTVGGAVVGNAGAHGGEVARDLISAMILEPEKGAVRDWTTAEMEFGYRTSKLKVSNVKPCPERSRRGQTSNLALGEVEGVKRQTSNLQSFGYASTGRREPQDRPPISNLQPVVLAATFRLQHSTREELEARAAEFSRRRKRSQPPGATMGSMFKNPPGDYAGRLIEAAGLKGMRIGNAQISPVHANFFVNLGGATAADMRALIDLAREKVCIQFGIELELEIEIIGEHGEK